MVTYDEPEEENTVPTGPASVKVGAVAESVHASSFVDESLLEPEKCHTPL